MIRGTVVGTVWATRKHAGLDGAKLALVASPDGRVVVARDDLDSRQGQDVVVAFGSAARNSIRRGGRHNRNLLADCAVIEVVDAVDPDGEG